MDSAKYIGMDVHKETISIAVLSASGKLVMELVIETKSLTIIQFVRGLRGRFARHPGRRNLGRLVVRSAAAACQGSCGV